MDLNNFTFTGRLCRPAELKSTNTGKMVCTINVAVDNSYKDANGNKVEDVCFIECVAWSKLAETISKYTDKGHRVGISGKLKLQSWERDGKKHYKHSVLIEDFTFLQPKSGDPVKDEFNGENVTGQQGFEEPEFPF